MLLALIFLGAGMSKVTGNPQQVASFSRWGFPPWFIYAVGYLEIGCGLGLLLPKLAGVSSALLGVVMIGAAATHAVHGESHAVPIPLLFFLLLAIVGYLRRAGLRCIVDRLRGQHLGPG